MISCCDNSSNSPQEYDQQNPKNGDYSQKKYHLILDDKKDISLSQKEEHGKVKRSLKRNDGTIHDLKEIRTPIKSVKARETLKLTKKKQDNEVKNLFLEARENLERHSFRVTNSSLSEQCPRIFNNSSYINKVLLRGIQKQHKQDFSLHMPDDDGYFQQRNVFQENSLYVLVGLVGIPIALNALYNCCYGFDFYSPQTYSEIAIDNSEDDRKDILIAADNNNQENIYQQTRQQLRSINRNVHDHKRGQKDNIYQQTRRQLKPVNRIVHDRKRDQKENIYQQTRQQLKPVQDDVIPSDIFSCVNKLSSKHL